MEKTTLKLLIEKSCILSEIHDELGDIGNEIEELESERIKLMDRKNELTHTMMGKFETWLSKTKFLSKFEFRKYGEFLVMVDPPGDFVNFIQMGRTDITCNYYMDYYKGEIYIGVHAGHDKLTHEFCVPEINLDFLGKRLGVKCK